MKTLTIGKVAREAGIGVDTVRFYEREGLLRQAKRSANGYRTYSEPDIDRLRFIRRAKSLGFSLEEIAELLQLNETRGGRAEVKRLAERRLADLEQKIREMTAIRDSLAHLVGQCSGKGALKGCPIIETVLAQHPDHREEN